MEEENELYQLEHFETTDAGPIYFIFYNIHERFSLLRLSYLFRLLDVHQQLIFQFVWFIHDLV